jgi:membrane-bound metal-dependent hydrolase YbcI (DUF457 family)
MTPVGHSITGVAIGLMAMPRQTPARKAALFLALCAVLANVPDFPLPDWGHERYDVSHSLFVNLALTAPLAGILFAISHTRRANSGARMVAGGGAAWLSHLLLDSFYNHGQGIGIFWPFSAAKLALPLPWFRVLLHPLPYIDGDALHIMGLEFVIYGAMLAAIVIARQALTRASPLCFIVKFRMTANCIKNPMELLINALTIGS